MSYNICMSIKYLITAAILIRHTLKSLLKQRYYLWMNHFSTQSNWFYTSNQDNFIKPKISLKLFLLSIIEYIYDLPIACHNYMLLHYITTVNTFWQSLFSNVLN